MNITSAEIHEDIKAAVNFARIRHSHIDNVLFLIESTIKRIRISLIIPQLAQNLDHMERKLKGTPMFPGVNLLSRLFLYNFSKGVYVDKDLFQIIQFFHANYAMSEFFPRYFNELSMGDKTLLAACDTLLAVARRHLKRSAQVEIDLEKQLREMYLKREDFKAKILKTKKILKSRNIAFHWRLAAKSVIHDVLERDLADRKWKNSVYIQNEISAREHELGNSHISTVKKQNELQQELKKARDNYDKLLKNIRQEEKNARSIKNRLIIQLQMLLHKFDSNMVQKNLECLELEDQYNVAKKELEDFMVGYRKEEAVYRKIVVQYEMEEQRKQQQRIALFMMNRAARRIQQYWQKWRRDKRLRERRAGRKKKK